MFVKFVGVKGTFKGKIKKKKKFQKNKNLSEKRQQMD